MGKLKKRYYIVESSKGKVIRLAGTTPNKKNADAYKRVLEKRSKSLDVIYWVDFEWV